MPKYRDSLSDEAEEVYSSELHEDASSTSAMPQNTSGKRRPFSFYLFWLVFWLTVVATILMSWQLLVVPLDWSPFSPIPESIASPLPRTQ